MEEAEIILLGTRMMQNLKENNKECGKHIMKSINSLKEGYIDVLNWACVQWGSKQAGKRQALEVQTCTAGPS